MTINVKYEANHYNEIPRAHLKRYVRSGYKPNEFIFCEVDERDIHFDVRQGTCDENDLPAAVVEEALARRGYWPVYVDWPRQTEPIKNKAQIG